MRLRTRGASRAWLAGRGARVAPLDPADATSFGDPIEELAEAVADRRKRAALSAVANAAQALEDAAEATAEAVTTFAFKFSDVVSSRGTAFLDSELQWYFRRWRVDRMQNGALESDLDGWITATGRTDAPTKPAFSTDAAVYSREMEQWSEDLLAWAVKHDVDEAMPGSPLEYAKRQRSGSPDAKLQLFLGPAYRGRLPGVVRNAAGAPQDGSRWSTLAGRLWPPGDAAAVTRARSVLDIDMDTPSSLTALRSTIDLVLLKTRAEFTQADVDEALRIIDLLVKRYRNADGTLDEAAVRRLMGRKDLTVEDLVDRVVTGIGMMKDEADLLGPDLINDLLRVPGIESFIESVVHKSGYEHGYRFEVFLAVRDLFVGHDRADLWMQVFVDGKMGPDIVKVLRDGNTVTGRIVQAKSYKNLNALLSSGDSGEIRRQILSDLQRIKGDNFRITGPGGEVIDVDPQIDFKIDFFRVRLKSFKIEGVDPADLRAAPNTAAAQRAREAFYDQHMRAKVDEINEWLASPELRAELGLGPDDVMPNFTLNVELADQVILPEFVQ